MGGDKAKSTQQAVEPEIRNEEAAPEFAVGIRVNDGADGDHVVATDSGAPRTDEEVANQLDGLFQDKINEGGEEVEGEAAEGQVEEPVSAKKEKKSRFGRKKKDDAEEASPKKSPEKKSRFGRKKKEEAPAEEPPAEEEAPAEEPPVEEQAPAEEPPAEEPPKEEAEPVQEEPKEKESPKKKSRWGKKKEDKSESPAKKEEESAKEESPKKEKKSRWGGKKKEKEPEPVPEPIVEEEKQEGEEEDPNKVPDPLFTKRVSHQPNLLLCSDNDPRTMKSIIWQNKMRVVLISDPLATKSVISVDVTVGNLHSPKKFDGLATIVQHMLVTGSNKYPDRQKNDEWLKQHGGSINAFSGMTNTNYQCVIDHNGFEEAVDRMANYFISPTFDAQHLEKEAKVIGHKFKRALIDDENRHLNLWMSQSNPESITNKLIYAQRDKVMDPETLEAVQQFYDAYYSSNTMAICLSTNLPLNDMERIAKSFKEIKNRNAKIPYVDCPIPYGPEESRRLFRMQSPTEEPQIRVTWCLPSYKDKITKIALKYFSELFGHQGPKSIIAYLKKEGLARSLDCRKKTIDNVTKFDVTVQLTNEGYAKYFHVVEVIFQFAHNVREAGPQENFANELNALGKLQYDFPERSDPLATCIKLSSRANKVEDIDLASIHRCSYVRELFDPKLIRNMAEMFCDPERVTIWLHTNEECTQQEKYMNIMYESMDDVENDFWEGVQTPRLGSGFGVPDVNGLVAHSYEMRPLDVEAIKAPIKLEHGDSWYMQDYKFQHPKAIVQLQIKTRDLSLGQDAKTQLFALLWKQVVLDFASEIIYAGSKAGMTFHIDVNAYDIQLYWRGFSMTMPDFIAQTLTAIIQVQKGRSSNQSLSMAMANSLQWMKQDMAGANAAKTYRQALDTLKGLMVEGACSEVELQKLLNDFDMDGDFASVKKQFLKHGHCTWFVHGNLTTDEANNIVNTGNSILGMKEIPYERLNPSSVALLQEGAAIVYQIEVEPTSFDTHLSYYQFGLEGRNIKSSVLNTLMQAYMQTPLYEELKGNQGMAKAAMRENNWNDCTGVWLLGMSDKHSAEEMNAAIMDQLLVFQKQIKSFSEKDFKLLKSALHEALMQNPQDLGQDNERYWREILSRKNHFNRPQRMADALQEVTRDEFIGHFETLFFSKSTRRLDVQMLTKANKPNQLVTWGKNENHPIYKSVLKRALFSGTFWEFKTRADYYPDAQLDTFKKGGF